MEVNYKVLFFSERLDFVFIMDIYIIYKNCVLVEFIVISCVFYFFMNEKYIIKFMREYDCVESKIIEIVVRYY